MFLRIHARRLWSDQSSSHVQRPWTWHWDWRKHTRTSFAVCYFSHRHNTEQGFHRECCVHIHNLPNHVSRGLHARVILAGYAQVILVRYAQARGLASFLFAFSPSACFIVRHRIKTCVLFQPINFLVKELIYIILWDHLYSRGFHCQIGSLCKRMMEHSTSCV